MTPKRHEEVNEWVRFALDDLRVAELALADDPPLTGASLFHAQQAVEKALKAFLIASDRPYPLTHDLDRLLSLCAAIDKSLATLSGIEELTDFAATSRYPGAKDPGDYGARSWLDRARAAVDEIRHRIDRM